MRPIRAIALAWACPQVEELHYNAYSTTNPMWRMAREGVVVQLGRATSKILCFDPKRAEPYVLDFHRAWLKIAGMEKECVWLKYVATAVMQEDGTFPTIRDVANKAKRSREAVNRNSSRGLKSIQAIIGV